MECRMPAASLPADFQTALSNNNNNTGSGQLVRTTGPGVAAYLGPDNTTRVDIFLGLVLDGYVRYWNISQAAAGLGGVQMEFYASPTMYCPTADVEFNARVNSTVQLSVSYSFTTGVLSVWRRACSNMKLLLYNMSWPESHSLFQPGQNSE